MDGRDELRALVQHRRDEDEALAREQAQLDSARVAYEEEEDAIRERLHDAAAAMLSALDRSGTATEIAVGREPRGLIGLFRSRDLVIGWEVELPFTGKRIVCSDGELMYVPPGRNADPYHSSLNEWIDGQIASTRYKPEDDGSRDLFAEVFRAPAPRGPGAVDVTELRIRLGRTADRVNNGFADILHQRGIEP
jgi:hypothetical protein